MRSRVATMLVAGAAMIASAVAAGPAAAVPATWTITPGGDYSGIPGEMIIGLQDSGVQLFCQDVELVGTAKSGSGQTNPLATITDTTFHDAGRCTGPLGYDLELDQVGTWTFNGISHDSTTGVTTGTIDNVVVDVQGPACAAWFTGRLDVTYTNSTHELRVLPFSTLVASVDPANDCLGLINDSEHVSFDGVFVVSPGMDISLQPS